MESGKSGMIQLNDGHSIPAVGLGVYLVEGQDGIDAVAHALRVGYRHIDTAQLYGNEAEVAAGIAASGVPREEVFITSKIWNDNHGYDKATASVRESLRKLNTEYIDLMLIHSPLSEPESRKETWRALIDLQKEGVVRSIGVSNYGVHHLDGLLAAFDVVPAVNQLELHPYLQRTELVEYCKSKGIVLQAYSPLCKGFKFADPDAVALAEPYAESGKTLAHLLLKWGLDQGYVVLPKSVTPSRIEANIDLFDFELLQATKDAFAAADEGFVTGWDPTEEP